MAKAVAARIFGDDYQALVFWLEACKMLIGEDDIEHVEIESDDVKSLDDVVVHYHDVSTRAAQSGLQSMPVHRMR